MKHQVAILLDCVRDTVLAICPNDMQQDLDEEEQAIPVSNKIKTVGDKLLSLICNSRLDIVICKSLNQQLFRDRYMSEKYFVIYYYFVIFQQETLTRYSYGHFCSWN